MKRGSRGSRTSFLNGALASVLLVFCTAVASAQDYPSRPIRFVVPSASGGGADQLARIIGQQLGERWAQPIVVENRTGAGGNIATEFVAKSTPDGYTWLLGFVGTHAVNPSLYKNISWDPIKDFTPVALLATIPFVLMINKDVPATSLAELLALAKAKPGELNYGSGGGGTLGHLFGAMLETTAGVKLTHVPYRGVEPAIADMIGGRIQIIFGTLPSAIGHIRAGNGRPIAVTTAKRSSLLPEVPSMAESGFPSFDEAPWFGLLTPANTPAAVVDKINSDVNRLLLQKEMVERFAKLGIQPAPSTPAQFGQIIRSDIAKFAKVVKESRVTLD